jgi:hypothetical protein
MHILPLITPPSFPLPPRFVFVHIFNAGY